MIKKLSLLFLVSVFMISCEDSSITENTIEGTWNVTEIIGGFAQSKNYEVGTFTWTFNLEEKTVSIINISQPFNSLLTPSFTNDQGGVYSFTIENENNIDYLVVGDRKGTIALNGNNLTIDYGIAFDDIAYVFKR
jgi:hypothetical protein